MPCRRPPVNRLVKEILPSTLLGELRCTSGAPSTAVFDSMTLPPSRSHPIHLLPWTIYMFDYYRIRYTILWAEMLEMRQEGKSKCQLFSSVKKQAKHKRESDRPVPPSHSRLACLSFVCLERKPKNLLSVGSIACSACHQLSQGFRLQELGTSNLLRARPLDEHPSC